MYLNAVRDLEPDSIVPFNWQKHQQSEGIPTGGVAYYQLYAPNGL